MKSPCFLSLFCFAALAICFSCNKKDDPDRPANPSFCQVSIDGEVFLTSQITLETDSSPDGALRTLTARFEQRELLLTFLSDKADSLAFDGQSAFLNYQDQDGHYHSAGFGTGGIGLAVNKADTLEGHFSGKAFMVSPEDSIVFADGSFLWTP